MEIFLKQKSSVLTAAWAPYKMRNRQKQLARKFDNEGIQLRKNSENYPRRKVNCHTRNKKNCQNVRDMGPPRDCWNIFRDRKCLVKHTFFNAPKLEKICEKLLWDLMKRRKLL